MTAERIRAQFGANVTEARDWAGLNQTELGERLSVSRQEIGNIECGVRAPRLDLVVRLAEVLELQVRDLLYGIE